MDDNDALGQEALALLRKLTGDPTSEFRPDQLDVIRVLVGERQAGAARAAHRLGQERRLLHRHPLLRDRGAGPDPARLTAARAHAQPDRGGRAHGRAGRHHQQREPATSGTTIEERLDDGHARHPADLARAARQRQVPRATCCPRSVGAAACSSSTRPTASPTGATTSGPTTAASSASSTCCPPACRCCAAPPPPTTGSSTTSSASSAPTSRRCAGRSAARACACTCSTCRARPSGSAWLRRDAPDAARHRHRLLPHHRRHRAGGRVAAIATASRPSPTAARPTARTGSPSSRRCWPTRSRSSSPPRRSAWASTSPTSPSSSTTSRPARRSPTTSRSAGPAVRCRRVERHPAARGRGRRHPGLLHPLGLPAARLARDVVVEAARGASRAGVRSASCSKRSTCGPASSTCCSRRSRSKARSSATARKWLRTLRPLDVRPRAGRVGHSAAPGRAGSR